MINNKTRCWYCKEKIGKRGSRHHLFNWEDFKAKMIETFGDLDKKEFKRKRLGWMKIKDKIPSFKIHTECHKELEIKIYKQRNFVYI